MKLGIALAGGGIRGIAHVGVLKALEENEIKIDIIGGTSSGSMVATLYALGFSPYYIYVLFKRYAKQMLSVDTMPIINTIGNFIANKKLEVCGFNSGKTIEEAYNQIALKKGIRKISDIEKPIVIPTVDINEAKEYIFTNNKNENQQYISDISIGEAVRASSSLPGYFCPCDFKGHKFLDGGILDNVPAREVKKQGADKVISVNFKADHIDENSNFLDISMRTIDIMASKITKEGIKDSDFILTVDTEETGLLDIEKIDSCYNLGYKTAMQNMDEIKSILK